MDLLIAIWMVLMTSPVLVGFFTNCCCTGCQYCNPTFAQSFQVVISGVADGTCSLCENLNGTFVCAANGEQSYPGVGFSITQVCEWRYSDTTTQVCRNEQPASKEDGLQVVVVVGPTGGGNYKLMVMENFPEISLNPTNGNWMQWQHAYTGTMPNCASLSSETTTLVLESFCDGTPATVTVTAL